MKGDCLVFKSDNHLSVNLSGFRNINPAHYPFDAHACAKSVPRHRIQGPRSSFHFRDPYRLPSPFLLTLWTPVTLTVPETQVQGERPGRRESLCPQ